MGFKMQRFDSFLKAIAPYTLQSLVQHWGISNQMSKNKCIDAICQGLRDGKQVRNFLADLAPFEQFALAMTRQLGGEIGSTTLILAAAVVGLLPDDPERPPPGDEQHPDKKFEGALIRPLIERGLFLNRYGYDHTSLNNIYGENTLFADERLLAQAKWPDFERLTLPSIAVPAATLYRQPTTVILDIVRFLRTIEAWGGLKLTQQGAIRANDLKKLRRIMQWQGDPIQVDGLPFPAPAFALIMALKQAELLTPDNWRHLVLKEPLDRFAERPYLEQVKRLLWGFLRLEDWVEWECASHYSKQKYPQGRVAVMMALSALPDRGQNFVALDDLDRVLCERICEYFTLYKPYVSRHPSSPPPPPEPEKKRRKTLRDRWLKQERVWLSKLFSTWPYYLGLVELGLDNDTVVGVRLTDLGREVLLPGQAAVPLAERTVPQPAWIVQPNFEVMLYLDRATPQQLVFLERHAEPVEQQQHVALYRLTRESVYHGLESGSSVDELLAGLEAGSQVGLPQNVRLDLQQWATLREDIVLWRQANLLEFEDEASRSSALAAGLKGRPVGERFVLLTAAQTVGVEAKRQINYTRLEYSRLLPRCLTVREDGSVQLHWDSADLLIEAQLDRWAERQSESEWMLTKASVAAALKGGMAITSLLDLLSERMTGRIPALLEAVLRAWAGKPLKVELGAVTVLRCLDPLVFDAIASSKKFQPYLRGQLGREALLVDKSKLKDLKKTLQWAGFDISTQVFESLD